VTAFNATVWIEDGWIKVRWPFCKRGRRELHHELRHDLKASIPYSSRKFSDTEKCWKVDVAYDTQLMEVLEAHCDEVVVLGGEDEPAAPAALPAGDDPAASLLALCPDTTLPKVWRVIAAALHPDAPAGDQERFVQASRAWEALRAARGV